jgi:ribose transport system substrate-binding protein
MFSRLKRPITVLALASLLASTAAVTQLSAGRAHAKTLTFYLIPGISTDAFYITMHVGAKAAAAKHGINLRFQGDPSAFSAPTQVPILNAAIASKPDAILIAPTDKAALVAPIQRAVKAGIAVILVDTTINTPNIAVTSISSDNLAGGVKAAKALTQLVGGKGQVALINVNPGISTTDQRQQGFQQQIRTYPNIKYVGVQFDNDNSTIAANKMSALITRYPQLAGVFAANTNSALGTENAVKSAGKVGKIKLVEFDAEPLSVQHLRAGIVSALIAQDPYTIGSMGVNLAYQYVTGHKSGIKKHYGTGEQIITKANVNNPAIKRFLYTRNG